MMPILDYLDGILYYPILIIVLIAAGLFFSWKTRCVQLRMFAESIRVVMEKPATAGAVSSFQALMVSTASRVGTGNIIGVSFLSSRYDSMAAGCCFGNSCRLLYFWRRTSYY